MALLRRSRFLSIAVAILVGNLITGCWLYVRENDLLHRWSRMPSPPVAGAQIVDIWGLTVYAQAPDGQVFAIEPDSDRGWKPVAGVPTTDPPDGTRRISFGECNRNDARFRWTVGAPADVRQCLEAASQISVAGGSLSVIRDSRDELWYFQTLGSDFSPDVLPSVIVCFLFATFVAFMLIRGFPLRSLS